VFPVQGLFWDTYWGHPERQCIVYIEETVSLDTGFNFMVYKIKSVITIGQLMDFTFFTSYFPRHLKIFFKIAHVITFSILLILPKAARAVIS
jgi:hypothetical protein